MMEREVLRNDEPFKKTIRVVLDVTAVSMKAMPSDGEVKDIIMHRLMELAEPHGKKQVWIERVDEVPR